MRTTLIVTVAALAAALGFSSSSLFGGSSYPVADLRACVQSEVEELIPSGAVRGMAGSSTAGS